MPSSTPVTAFPEVPAAPDMRVLSDRSGVDAQYLVRRRPNDRPGALLPEAASTWKSRRQTGSRLGCRGVLDDDPPVRRLLVRAGLPKADIWFHGYFRHGAAQYEG